MNDAYATAIRLLARREHGATELVQKLTRKGMSEQDAQAALAACQQQGLQSDERFTESYCRSRVRQGYGSKRIEQELKQRQIDDDIIHQALAAYEDEWLGYAKMVREKKFGHEKASSFLEEQKHKQFLHYRGFASEIINQLTKLYEDEKL